MSAAPDARADAPAEAHLDDAVVIRALDGELLPEDGDAAAHLAACARCSARAAQFAARRTRLAALLAAADAPAPAPVSGPAPAAVFGPERGARPRRPAEATPGRRQDANRWAETPVYVTPAAIHAVPGARTSARTGARLAAAGVLLAAAGLAAQPVRRWAAERWADLADAPAAPYSAADGVPVARSAFDTSAPAAPPPVVVAFTPERGSADEPFTLRFDERPAGGTLTVRVAPGARATAVARPERGGRAGEFVVLPAGLRVRNAAAPHGTYELTLPAGTNRLRVTFGAPPGDVVLALGGRTPLVVPLRAP